MPYYLDEVIAQCTAAEALGMLYITTTVSTSLGAHMSTVNRL